jgi:hypothetical protein
MRIAGIGEMSALDTVIPTPHTLEVDWVDLALPPEQAWQVIRHGDLAKSLLVRALFAARTLPSRLRGEPTRAPTLRLADMVSSQENPGFQVLVDDAPHEVVVGAIGQVWKPDIPFVHVSNAEAFVAFADPGFVKVAWSLVVTPHGERGARVTLELRVDATDEEAWRAFRGYFRLIGPFSHYIRRSLLASLAKEFGTPESNNEGRPLPGDDLLLDAVEQITHGVTIAASPEAIWPWLVQMGCRRGGFYSIDGLDNGFVRSAREIHPELQDVHVGDVLPATPQGNDGFEVLRVEANRTLVLGGLYDDDARAQRPFASARPRAYWHVTWAFVLERLDEKSTRLHVRARVAFPPLERLHAVWIRPAHHFMEGAQLRHLAERAEGRLARDDWRDLAEGVGGAAIMAAAFLSSPLRRARGHWGLDAETANRVYPGDERIPDPRWGWTHGITINASAENVWPWVAQIGADRAGFYSYQWLENIAGCELRNAERVHPEWVVRDGSTLRLHPDAPPLDVVSVVAGRYFVAYAPPDAAARFAGKPWAEATWLFFLEPLEGNRCRFVSRYRCACSDDLATRLAFGPSLLEPIGFAMDRRMLMGVKERAERVVAPPPRHPADEGKRIKM